MLILPIKGDKLTLSDGRLMSVDSFSSFTKNPSVLAHQEGDKPVVVSFSLIRKINDTDVKSARGSIFQVPGDLTRKVHIPQQDDKVTAVLDKKTQELKVKRPLLDGGSVLQLFIECTNDLDEKVQIPASSIISLKRASGNSSFSVRSFQSLYLDYMG